MNSLTPIRIIQGKPEGGAFTIWIWREHYATRGSVDQIERTKLGILDSGALSHFVLSQNGGNYQQYNGGDDNQIQNDWDNNQ